MDQRPLAAAVIERFVTAAGLDTEALDDGAVVFAVEESHGAWGCVLTPLVGDVVLIESIAPLKVPADKHRIVAELLGLLNVDVLLGAMVLDTDLGQVSARTAVDVERLAGAGDDPAALGAELLQSPVATNIATMDRWLPAVMVVVHSRTVPAEAVAAIRARG